MPLGLFYVYASERSYGLDLENCTHVQLCVNHRLYDCQSNWFRQYLDAAIIVGGRHVAGVYAVQRLRHVTVRQQLIGRGGQGGGEGAGVLWGRYGQYVVYVSR